MYAKSEDSVNEISKHFESRTESAIVKYIFDTWIPYELMFVSAWANRITHFGHTVTSWGGSAHCMLKQYLPTSMDNILSCCKKLYLAIGSNHEGYDVSQQRQQMRVCNYAYPTPHGMILQDINLKISYFALYQIYKHLKIACQPQKNNQRNCTGVLNTVWVLSCSNKLRLYLY